MRPPEVVDLDSRARRLQPSQARGADSFTLQTQITRYRAATAGMPLPWDDHGSDGALALYNGITRATRIAELAPGTRIRVEAVGQLTGPVGPDPKMGDTLL